MKITGFVFLALLCFTASADELKDKNAAKELAISVMNKVSEGKTIEGVDLVKNYLIVPSSEFETLKNQISMQAPMLDKRFGKTIGVVLLISPSAAIIAAIRSSSSVFSARCKVARMNLSGIANSGFRANDLKTKVASYITSPT